jgi:hypothetical protein
MHRRRSSAAASALSSPPPSASRHVYLPLSRHSCPRAPPPPAAAAVCFAAERAPQRRRCFAGLCRAFAFRHAFSLTLFPFAILIFTGIFAAFAEYLAEGFQAIIAVELMMQHFR